MPFRTMFENSNTILKVEPISTCFQSLYSDEVLIDLKLSMKMTHMMEGESKNKLQSSNKLMLQS